MLGRRTQATSTLSKHSAWSNRAGMMSSSQTPLQFSPNHARGRRDSNLGPSTLASRRAEDLDRFIMDQRRFTHPGSSPHTSSPHVSAIGNTHYVDFSYPFTNAMSSSPRQQGGDANMDHHPDPYTVIGRASLSESRASLASVGRVNSSSTVPYLHIRDESVEGSDPDPTSPESVRGRQASMGNEYGDEYEANRDATGDGSETGFKSQDVKDDPTPLWSEMKTKAGKERKRLPLACIACRRKKIRCSGEKPACKHCLKSRMPCVYRVTTRKAAPRTDYMVMLDKRLKRMEERIIKIVPKDEHDPTAVSRAQVKPTPMSNSPLRAMAGKKRMADEAFGEELDAWARSSSRVKNGGTKPSSLHIQEAEESKLLFEGEDALPSRSLQEHLAEVFFDSLYGQSYHLLHKPSFMRKLKAGTIPPVLMLSVCAVSARFSTHPKLNTQPAFLRGESWAAPAREIVMKRYDWPNITILTCLLLLAQHEFGTCYGGRSWALGGMAIRMAYTLQLHKDLEYDPLRAEKSPLSFIDREVRRRAMWACFLMDRFTSSGTNRPMFIKEEIIKAQLPVKERFFQLDIERPTEDLKGSVPHPASADSGQLTDAKGNMGVAAYTIRAISLWGRIVIYLFQSDREVDEHAIWDPRARFMDLSKEADDFLGTLPGCLKYTTENLRTHETEGLPTQYLFLHLAAQQNTLFLNHIAAHESQTGKPHSQAPWDFVAKAQAKAYEASKSISQILRDGESNPVNTPFGGYCAFWSSSVQMSAIFSKNSAMELEAKKNLATNVRYLSKIKRYWGAFYWTSQHLKEQYKACADSVRQLPERMPAPMVSSIYHYGDWFDRYPHGVSETDFEDPSTKIKKEVGDDAVLQQKNDYHTVQEFFSTLSPAPPQLERESTKNLTRENARKNVEVPPRSKSLRLSADDDLNPGPATRIFDTSNQELRQQYPGMDSNNNGGMFAHPAYFGQTNVFDPPQQPLLPLSRQLDLVEYPGGGDLMGFNGISAFGGDGWDIHMGNIMNGWMEDPSNAWLVPFNMGPPVAGQDGDVFNSLGGSGVNYQVGGMSIDNMGNLNGMAGSSEST